MPETAPEAAWGLVVPVKGGAGAKSRLGRARSLAGPIAADTLRAVAACPLVGHLVVVSGDGSRPGQLGAAAHPGLRVHEVTERPGARDGLNPAIRHGLAELRRVAPHGPAAVLLGDLPALTAGALATALEAVRQLLDGDQGVPRAFVPDADGEGTVLLAARRPGFVEPRFGAGSARAHERGGAARLALDLPPLRRDVDTPGDLERAARLGLGPATARALLTVELRDTDLRNGEPRDADLPDGARTA